MNNSEKFIRLNTAVVVEGEVAKEAIAVSERFAGEHGAFFVLDGVSYYPHMTVYAPEYPEENKTQVIARAEEIVKETQPFALRFTEVKNVEGFIGVYAEKTVKLMRLHERLIEALNPLREAGHREKEAGKLDGFSFSPKEQENMQRYGHPWVRSLYDPHLTLTRLKDAEAAARAAEELAWRIEEMFVQKIGVFVSGEHGTCRELLASFRLGGS